MDLLLILLFEDNADHIERIQRSLADNRVAHRITLVDNVKIAIQVILIEK